MRARLLASCGKRTQFPSATLPEVAVAGRSNCGKSSLINALTGHQRLARTSSTPGRTRLIFFFAVELPHAAPFCLVDLPGYGFARVSRAEQNAWAPLINSYIDEREQLEGLLLLLDIRRAPVAEERDLLDWAVSRKLRHLVVLTKADKLSKHKRFAAQEAARKALGLRRRPLAFSVNDPTTIEHLRRAVAELAHPQTSRGA